MPGTTETDVTRRSIVRVDTSDERDWLGDSPLCPLFAGSHIAHVGLLEAGENFEISRPDQSGTFMLACYGGSGLVRADGQWKKVAAGQACLLPPFVTNAMRATGREPWRMAWVRYLESRETAPVVSATSPVLGAYDPQPLIHAIQGLHAECSGASSPSQLHLWTELIHSYVLRFAHPRHADPRLARLWGEVGKELDRPWTLADLAGRAFVCKEHLRRLCRDELGRSPMQHVTFLRMQAARHLLATTGEKVETITRQVGYSNPHTFSNTFKKWIGWRPSEYRA
jgi:AraC-like DNA-binding protein